MATNLIQVSIEALDAASPIFAEVASSAERMGASFVEAGGGQESLATGSDELAAQLDALQAVVAELSTSAGLMSSALLEAGASAETFAASASQAGAANQLLAESGSEAAAGLEAIVGTASEAGAANELLAESGTSAAAANQLLASSGAEAATSLEGIGAAATAAASGEQAVTAGATEAAASQKALAASTAESNDALTLLGGNLEKVGGGAGVLGVALTGGVALGFAAAGKEAAGFQSELMNVANNANMSTAQMDQMGSTVTQLATESGQSMDLLAQGFMHAADISHSAAAATSELTVANEAAIASGDNVAQTTNLLANVMHEFSMDTGDAATVMTNAAQAMGVMHLAASDSNMTLTQFTENSGKVMGIAANLGIPLEQVSAAFAALTLHGYDAAQAQTQLVGIMTHMIAPSKAQETELARLSQLTGVDLVSDFSAAGLNAKGLTGVMDDLTTAYMATGMSQAQATGETMKLLAAMRGGLGMSQLLGTAQADYQRILADVSDTTKTASITQDQYDRTLETSGQQFKIAEQNAQSLAIALGNQLLPALSNVAQSLTTSMQSAEVSSHGALGQIASDVLHTGASIDSGLIKLDFEGPVKGLELVGQGAHMVGSAFSDAGNAFLNFQDTSRGYLSQVNQDMQGVQQHTELFRMAVEKLAPAQQHLVDLNQEIDASQKQVDASEQQRLATQAQVLQQIDAQTTRLARLRDLNEGVTNTIQQATQQEMAQIVATNSVNAALGNLHNTYETGLGLIQVYNSASSEYQTESQAISDAVGIINQKKREGIPLSQQENDLLTNQGQLLGRLNGGVQDNKEQAGLAAGANVELMNAQDALNGLLRQGITSGAGYDAAMQQVQAATDNAKALGLNPASDAAAQFNQSLASLQGEVKGDLVPAIQELQHALDSLKPPPPIDILANDKPARDAVEAVNNQSIKDKNFDVTTDTGPAQHSLTVLDGFNVNDKHFTVNAQDMASSVIQNIIQEQIPAKYVTIYGQYVSTGGPGGPADPTVANARGTMAQFGPGGVPHTVLSKINEQGPELVIFPFEAHARGGFAGDGTAAIVNGGQDGVALLPQGTQVIPADQTAQILSGVSSDTASAAFSDLQGSLSGIADGSKALALQQQIADEQFILHEAQAMGAPDDYVKKLTDDLSKLSTELQIAQQAETDWGNSDLAVASMNATAAKQRSDALTSAYSNVDKIADGSAIKAAQATLVQANAALVAAQGDPNADAATLEALHQNWAKAYSELQADQEAYAALVASGQLAAAQAKQIADQQAQATKDAQAANIAAIQSVIADPQGAAQKAQSDAAAAAAALRIAQQQHASEAEIIQLQKAAADAAEKSREVGQAAATAAADGYGNADMKLSDAMIADIQAAEKQVPGLAADLVSQLTSGIEDGTISAAQASQVLPGNQDVLNNLKQEEARLTTQLADAYAHNKDKVAELTTELQNLDKVIAQVSANMPGQGPAPHSSQQNGLHQVGSGGTQAYSMNPFAYPDRAFKEDMSTWTDFTYDAAVKNGYTGSQKAFDDAYLQAKGSPFGTDGSFIPKGETDSVWAWLKDHPELASEMGFGDVGGRMDEGGIINEPMLGIGLRSHGTVLMGERRPEVLIGGAHTERLLAGAGNGKAPPTPLQVQLIMDTQDITQRVLLRTGEIWKQRLPFGSVSYR